MGKKLELNLILEVYFLSKLLLNLLLIFLMYIIKRLEQEKNLCSK
jgi:hypothetical protein